MHVVAGVDCHKSTHTVVFLTPIGEVLGSLTFPTTPDGYEAAIELGRKFGCTRWGIEGSGMYGRAFAVSVCASDATVFEVPGSYTKRYRKTSTHRGKSDLKDAKAIAEVVLREETRLPLFSSATMQRALRLRYDQRDRMIRDRSNAANRLRSAALQLGVASLPVDITPTKKASHLRALAARYRQQYSIDAAVEAVLDEICDAADFIIAINAKIRAVERQIRSLVEPIGSDLLALHGISYVAAAGLIGHAGDIGNCRDAAAFAMKCGAAPIQCSSGRREAVRVNLGGDRQLNRLLHVAAMSQVRRADHRGRKYYDRKRAEGKTHLAAMRCLKRTLATIVFYRLQSVEKTLRISERPSDKAT